MPGTLAEFEGIQSDTPQAMWSYNKTRKRGKKKKKKKRKNQEEGILMCGKRENLSDF